MLFNSLEFISVFLPIALAVHFAFVVIFLRLVEAVLSEFERVEEHRDTFFEVLQ